MDKELTNTEFLEVAGGMAHEMLPALHTVRDFSERLKRDVYRHELADDYRHQLLSRIGMELSRVEEMARMLLSLSQSGPPQERP